MNCTNPTAAKAPPRAEEIPRPTPSPTPTATPTLTPTATPTSVCVATGAVKKGSVGMQVSQVKPFSSVHPGQSQKPSWRNAVGTIQVVEPGQFPTPNSAKASLVSSKAWSRRFKRSWDPPWHRRNGHLDEKYSNFERRVANKETRQFPWLFLFLAQFLADSADTMLVLKLNLNLNWKNNNNNNNNNNNSYSPAETSNQISAGMHYGKLP